MTPKETLIAARALIADMAHWTQGVFAADLMGENCSALFDRAHCFCALGAIAKVANIHPRAVVHTVAAERLAEAGNFTPFQIAEFNDTHAHPEVLALFDTAIEREPA